MKKQCGTNYSQKFGRRVINNYIIFISHIDNKSFYFLVYYSIVYVKKIAKSTRNGSQVIGKRRLRARYELTVKIGVPPRSAGREAAGEPLQLPLPSAAVAPPGDGAAKRRHDASRRGDSLLRAFVTRLIS